MPPTSLNRLSACLITLNEERRLPTALASLTPVADEIIVVDSGSTDATEEIARRAGAKFFLRSWTNYAEQKNFAAAQASNDWILSLDADEELSAQLQTSLLEWKQRPPKFQVYEASRRAWYLGDWIRHSGWYPNFQRRLYRRDSAKFTGIIHEALRFTGAPGRLHGDILHYTIDSLAEHEEKVARYSALAAQQMYASGRTSWLPALLFATPWSWLRTYIVRGGFLDGYRGALIAQMAARSVRLKYGQLGELVRADHQNESRAK
jgi:glycosyltransferase involved in cell wall biosynthesis